MSDTSLSFIDPVFLARFGLSRINALDYFLHPLNPFRSKTQQSSNEILSMQGISLDTLQQSQIQQQHLQGRPYDIVSALRRAEEEYNQQLEKLVGEQYELLPPPEIAEGETPAAGELFVIRHVLRSSKISKKVLGIYYIIQGVIYKSPSVRSVVKANIARALQALAETCEALSTCAVYEPTMGYTWDFELAKKRKGGDDNVIDEDNDGSLSAKRPTKKRMRKVLDNRPPGEATEEEEEGLRAIEAIDKILVRLSKSEVTTATLKDAPA
uniref:Mediator of RNA polymerase II transcription subunit 6 n=1 Tax=Leptocylindrus danicus TaxID=163516 RepID=A0A7S2LLS6_9STRA|mmetsp:Transcript_7319/g.10922  ORF Transcript_7319/g.10922 Transcript_7319/m.10922 type:complete len:268 (+) Transcript_7319:404-1207(+)|eukprot:CAMPEP_0116014420 /NCGR_PEP_ID=MMETSP0321-20121206/6264_1 /TAXON_ID=163516 /ORGANISM="Leptocylindrus danicus var. danicus, Strain B650" /LENGTH=267 /DNA_ID=CAMNT_0003484063 /DNA_START=386 /DNA_END=1189 /DNA_ORIENTATION=+